MDEHLIRIGAHVIDRRQVAFGMRHPDGTVHLLLEDDPFDATAPPEAGRTVTFAGEAGRRLWEELHETDPAEGEGASDAR